MWNELSVWIQERVTFSTFKISLKCSFLINHIVMAVSGDPESPLSYAAIFLGYWGLPMMSVFFAHVFSFTHVYAPL